MSGSLRVAVTGGSGNIGTVVIRELVSRGHKAINLDRRQARQPVEGVPFHFVDLRRRELIQPIFAEVDAVCHLGEIPSPLASLTPEEVFSTNTTIGSAVLQTAADLKLKHVVYTSTFQVYGTWGWPQIPPATLPVDESHPLRPQNTYSLSKVCNEAYAKWVSDRYGLSVSIFRLPYTSWELDERMVSWIERDERLNELGTYLLSADAAVAYVNAVERSLPGCEVYQLAADDVAWLKPIGESIIKANLDYPAVPTDWPSAKSLALNGKAKEKLGWAPKSNFLEEYRKKRGRESLTALKHR
jgi:nucleoside-diphosphate-sugar epimerase